MQGSDHSVAPPSRSCYISGPAKESADEAIDVGRRQSISKLISRVALPMATC